MTRAVFTPSAIFQLLLGWVAFAAMQVLAGVLAPPLPAPALIITLTVVVSVIVLASLGVVHQAEAIARRLGDPFGSLVLTLSIVAIEVILIAAVMLGPGEHATIARDSVTAVMMIILNLVVGICLVVGDLRQQRMHHNRAGTTQYIGMIAVLVSVAFIIPAALQHDGTYPAHLVWPVAAVTIALYGFFLWRQVGANVDDFREPDVELTSKQRTADLTPSAVREISLRAIVLIATMIPIVLLSHDLAGLLDDALGRVGAPVALSGMLIALIVFTPEGITSVRAAARGELQRVVNLCLGAFVSTVGLTIPVVLIIGLLTDQAVVLAASPVMLVLLISTVVLTMTTFANRKPTAVHGALHLTLFAVYGLALFTAA